MGTSNIQVFNGRYRGLNLTDEDCNKLDQIIELDKTGQKIAELEHIIYTLDDTVVDNYISQIENNKTSSSLDTNDLKVGTLRADQTLGVAFMLNAKKCILGDSVGMGKTVETAGLIQALKSLYAKNNKPFRYCVFTETNLTAQFRKEMIKFTGEYAVLLPNAEQNNLTKFYDNYPYTDLGPNIVGSHSLITAPIFIQWCEQYKAIHNKYPFDLFIVDESSILGGSDTKIVETFKLLSKNVERIVFLNATPFESQLDIFYNQLNILDSTLMPTKASFQDQFVIMDYTGIYPKPTGKYKNADLFRQYIGYRYFARTRKDNGAEIKDCEGGIILSPLSTVQKKMLNRTTMYRMVYDCPNYLDPMIEFNEENVPKLKSLYDVLNTKCKGQQVIIFVPYIEAQTEICYYLKDKGYKVDILNGKVKQKQRHSIIESFSNNNLDILITNVQKGLNFGNCNYCIFYSFDTNPSKMLQFEGRITRDFDIVGKNIYILCSEGKEEKTLNEVLRERTKATTEFTNADISVILDILLKE